jgi:para-nitrobenzyl esterase
VPEGIVDTRHGKIRGIEEDGLWRFLGVRYGAPPAGELRLRPTVAPERQDGVVDAVEFGPNAPQLQPTVASGVPGDPAACDEDCLFLNVWTPGLDTRRRPVMVFVHGGAFVSGTGASLLYRGQHLARRGDVVVVTINYRLGILGFAGHRDLAAPASGAACANWGLYDQVEALRWVQQNISGFGGDPDNVTVFGESAGGISICSLLGAPGARGLFRRAIVESGPAVAIPLEAAGSIAELLMSELGRPGASPAELRSVPLGELLEAQASVGAHFDGGAGLALQPVVDGILLPRHPADAVAGGASAATDLLIGTNRDEFKFFAMAVPQLAFLDEDALAVRVQRGLRSAGLDRRVPSEDVISAYRAARSARGASTSPFELFTAMASDWLFRVPQMRLAETHSRQGGRVYTYLFEWESPFAGGALGACHALELPFVFGTLVHPAIGPFCGSGPDAIALSASVQDAWIAFAREGDPAPGGAGELGPWPAYEPELRSTMVLGPTSGFVEAPLELERSFWDRHLGRYGVGGPVEGGDTGRATLDTAGLSPEAAGT